MPVTLPAGTAILWDIDGTLLQSAGSGRRAMARALQLVTGLGVPRDTGGHARANRPRHRCAAATTGTYTYAELGELGADAVFEDLADTDALVKLIASG